VARKKHTPNDPDRRQRILDAAIAVLQDGGIPAVSARAIAARAEVPVGSVSYHFDSIRSLLREALRSIIEFREQSLREWNETVTEGDVVERLAELIHAQITTGRNLTVVAYELYLLGLRDPEFRALSIEATSVLSRQLAVHLPEEEARRLAAVADGVQMHSLFLRPAPPVTSIIEELSP